MKKDAMRAAALVVGGLAERRTWDGPLSGAMLKASQALHATRHTTALVMVRLCPELGTADEVRTAMADRGARDRLLCRWADIAVS